VRFQGLTADGSIVFECDTQLAPGTTRQLLPKKALMHGVQLGETFVISSNAQVVLFANSFHAFAARFFHLDIDLNDKAYGIMSHRAAAAKRQIDLTPLDCQEPDYSFFCDTPTRQRSWGDLAQ